MGLVDDQGVVAAQVAVVGDFGQQNAVGHHLDPGLPAGLGGEPHLVAHHVTQRRADLFGDAFGQAARGDAAGLGVTDAGSSGGEAELGQLGGLARTGLARHDQHLVVANGRHDVVGPRSDRQRRVDGQ